MRTACRCCGSRAVINRRNFLAGAAGAAATTLMAESGFAAPTGPDRIIDVHHHFQPSGKNADGNEWSPHMAMEELERNAVTAAIGWCGFIITEDIAAGRKQARDWNEWGTKLCSTYPGRFGLFASLPFGDIDGSLAEIRYAYDVLKADGIGLTTSYGNSWLGDQRFALLWQELDARHATVFVHPFDAPCCRASSLSYETGVISSAWMEWPFNTARTILSLLASGTTRKFPNIKFIFSHGGGVMPILIGRLDGFVDWKPVGAQNLKELFPDGIYGEYRKLYFECAQAYAPETMQMLREILPGDRLLYGSDFSYFPMAHSLDLVKKLELPAIVRQALLGGNAASILAKWA